MLRFSLFFLSLLLISLLDERVGARQSTRRRIKSKNTKSAKSESQKTKKEVDSAICGMGTELDLILQQCVPEGRATTPIPEDCDYEDAECFCDAYGFGTRGPKLGPHPICQKYVSCGEEATIMQCDPGYVYDVTAQICFYKESVDCSDREAIDIGDALPSKCLSELNPDDPICGCETYLWNSVTLVPEECYESEAFQCTKDAVVRNDLEIGIGDGIRPGRAPSDYTETAANTGPDYLDAPWLESDSNPDGEYPYLFPLDKTAVIMIDFQRDFVCPGGFGETLGNTVEDLQKALQPARNVLNAARALGMPIIHTLESHKSDLSDLKDNKYNRGNLPNFLRIGEELDLGRILVRGSCGNNIVDMVAPMPGEYVVFKPGKTAFYMTEFDDLLQSLAITHLLVAGVTTEVCMQSTVREATDRGYEPLIITDATASYFERYRQQTIEQLVAQGALVSWAANSTVLLKALAEACD